MANSEYVDVFRTGAVSIDRWRTENPDIKPDLSGADLSGADLTETNLVGADLSGANLTGADLSGADLVGANLAGSNLEKADLCFADLCNADLSWANFHGSNLREVDFNGARSRNTLWVNVDLSRAVNLELVSHGGPSTLGMDTLMSSRGHIPAAFLRGCGLSNELIEYIAGHFEQTALDFFSCFICYSPEDAAFAERLYAALQSRGIRCWLDEKQTLTAAAPPINRNRGMKILDKVLLCTSQHSLKSEWVNVEIERAFDNEDREFKRDTNVIHSLLPLNLDQHLFGSWEHQQKEVLCNRVAADFQKNESDPAVFDREVERLIGVLQSNP
ncbi:pentapeptide repeat-containing protein [Gimesia sp.]|uniref:toll/interleukin-1 receptor domain-containing protein n=1 Tax=Gimesia sp. TaxID=2024833 RepID=UPI003A93965B